MTQWLISASVLTATVCVLRTVLKEKVSPVTRYALWAMVLVRLLIPVNFSNSALSVLNYTEDVENTRIYEMITLYIPTSSEEVLLTVETQASTGAQTESADVQMNTSLEKSQTQNSPSPTPAQVLRNLWIAGMVVMTVCLVGSNLCFSLRLQQSRKTLKIPNAAVKVYVTRAVQTPCLYGLFRPCIYVTPEVAKDQHTLTYVLAHESTHYRHLDHIWSLLRSVCLVLHWYNPLVWLAVKLSRQDGELACDAGTIARLGEKHRAEYGRTLIVLTTNTRLGNYLVTATTMTGGKRAIQERIVILMKHPKTTFVTALCLILCCAALVGCTFTGAKETTVTATTVPETTQPAETTQPFETATPDDTQGNITPVELTQEQIDEVNEAFASTVSLGENMVGASSVSCFFTSYYTTPAGIDLAEFMRYFSPEAVMEDWSIGGVTLQEVKLLSQQEPWPFGKVESWDDLDIPVSKYPSEMIDMVLQKFAGVALDDLDDARKSDSDLMYLEEYDAYYNYTSDFGAGIFQCTGGKICDGYAILYGRNSFLVLREENGNYYITAHMPYSDEPTQIPLGQKTISVVSLEYASDETGKLVVTQE